MKIAALLNENGAEVQLVTRGLLHWLSDDSMQNRTMGFLLQATPASRDFESDLQIPSDYPPVYISNRM